jgi:hypothetical protein
MAILTAAPLPVKDKIVIGPECPFRNFLNRVSRLDSKEEA